MFNHNVDHISVCELQILLMKLSKTW